MITPQSETVLEFPAVWLRDNCGCTSCRDPQSSQKLQRITDLPEDLEIVDLEYSDAEVVVTFSPDGHRSVFALDWLTSQLSWRSDGDRSERHKTLWRAEDLEDDAQHAQWSTYRRDDDVRLAVLPGIEQLGFAVLHGTPVDEGTVLTIARTFGFVRVTNYGELFDVRIEANPSNLAFTGAVISPHTDNPYRDPVPTMQLLHCLANDVIGGESGLVDGFQASSILRDEYPHFFEVLTETPVSFAWSDASNVLRAKRPMIELDSIGRIRAVRFNNRSLQPLRMNTARIGEYYDAYRAFAQIIDRPELLLTFRLDSGDCLIFDNTRILHARTAFEETSTGKRHLQGCYADLDGLASTVAVLERDKYYELSET